MCIADVFDENYEILLNEFKCKFDKLYKDFKLPMTLKIHAIVDHYSDYFKETGNFLNQQMMNIMRGSITVLKFLNLRKVST